MAPAGSGRELQANFITFCSQLGTPGAWVIYGPCQVEGGEKKREREGEGGPALGLRLGNCGAEKRQELSKQRWRKHSSLLFLSRVGGKEK